MKMLTLLGIFIFSISAFAMNGRTTYQAKIVKPDGYPLQSSSVNFRFTVLDPAASCVLYVEDYAAINMIDSGGLISFALGGGVRSFPTSGTPQTFQNTFDNSINSFSCQSPGIYNPTPTDVRKVVMQFNDGNGWQTLPAMTINAVPYAMYANKSNDSKTLNGKADTAFVETSTLAALNCNAATHAITFNGVSFSCIPVGVSSSGITSVTTSGTVLLTGGTASAPVISIQAATMSQDGYLTSLDYAEFKAKLSASSTQIINTLGYAPVSSSAVATQINNSNLSGDVSGTVSANSVVSVGGKSAGQISASVNDTLAATASSTADTIVKRNSSGNVTVTDLYANAAKINYVDIYKPSTSFNIRLQAPTSLSTNYVLNLPTASGTIGQVLSTDGAGNLSWINPSTGSVVSVSATAPLASTGGSNPTITIAQATSSTNGYLSSTDWNTFNNKQQATSAAIIATLGYTPADNAASGTYAQTANNLSDLTNIPQARSNLGLGTLATGNSIDLGSASATGIIADARLQNQTSVTSGTQYTKVTVDGKGRVTSGAQLSSSDVTTALGYTPANAASAGITTLNGSSTGTQTFATGNAGTAFAVTTSNGIHTFAIPLAASSSVTAGLLSNTDFTTFTNKQNATSSAIITTLGYTPANSATLGSLAWVNFVDLGTSQASGTLAVARLPSFSGDVSSVSGSNSISLNTVGAGVTSGTQYTKVTVDGKGRVTSGSQLSSSDVTNALGYTPPTSTTLAASFVQKAGDTMMGALVLAEGTNSLASLKFTSGTLLSTPASGAIEYDGSNLYFTDGTNTRRALAVTTGAGSYDNANLISNSSGDITMYPNGGVGSVVVSAVTASTSSNTGALVVKGGLGVAGNINTVGNLNVSGSSVIDGSLKLSLMTSGSVLFAGTNGVINQDNSKFFWDGANKRLGLGTNAPAQTLSVSGTSYFSTNVGIGTSNPISVVHISGTPVASANFGLVSIGNGPFDGSSSGFFTGNTNGVVHAINTATGFTGDFAKYQNGTSDARFIVKASGAVVSGRGSANGTNSSTFGGLNSANGAHAFAVGHFNNSSGNYSFTTGLFNNATGDNSTAMGYYVTANSLGMTALGINNVVPTGTSTNTWQGTDPIFVIGNGQGSAPASASTAITVLKNGNTGIGVLVPTAILHLAAGNSLVAPMKLSVSTLTTTPQSGAIEYDGNDYYITDSVGVRRMIATASTGGVLNNTSVVSSTAGITLWPASGNSVVVSSTVASTNSSNGALIVKGGVGVAGNLFASGVITTTSSITGQLLVATLATYSPALYGSSVSAGSLTLDSTSHGSKGNILINALGGNVAVGTATPTSRLDVGVTAADDGITLKTGLTPLAKLSKNNTTNDGRFALYSSGTVRISLAASGDTYFNNGNIGIGTTTPKSPLDVNGIIGTTWGTAFNTSFNGTWNQTTTGYAGLLQFEASTGKFYFWNTPASATANSANPFPVQSMTIDKSGNVGIGTASPGALLDVAGNVRMSGANPEFELNTGGPRLRVPAGNTIAFHTGGGFGSTSNERMRIDSTGNVGIGTISPNQLLHISSNATSTDTMARIETTNAGSNMATLLSLKNTGREYHVGNGNPARADGLQNKFYIYDNTSGTARFVIDPSGNVGVGTTTPDLKLAVNGHVRIGDLGSYSASAPPNYGNALVFSGAIGLLSPYSGENSDPIWMARYNTAPNETELRLIVGDDPGQNADRFVFGTCVGNPEFSQSCTWAQKFYIGADGSGWMAGSLTQASDMRLKKEILPIANAIEKLQQINGVTYNWNEAGRSKSRQIGLIAQDVEKVFPEAVNTDSKTGLKAVAYQNLVAPVIEAIKELYAKLIAQDERVAVLARDLASLRADNEFLRKQADDKSREVEALKARMERIEQQVK